MEKLTNVKALEMVLGLDTVKANAELTEKLEKMKAQFEKKNSTTGKLTKAQEENQAIKTVLLDFLQGLTEPIQIKEIQKVEGFTDFSNQKLSALLKQMVEVGEVEKVIDKKVTKFKAVKIVVAVEETEEEETETEEESKEE